MKKITLLDLFSGIGGFHLGLKKAGFKIKSYNSEIDKYAIDCYKYNFKDSKYVGSVKDVSGSQLPRINGITFGSPCQDFSIAGDRKGMDGERSSLIIEAIRLIKECRPDFFIWENVKGTYSSNSGEDFAAILQAFTNVGGYRLEWQLLNTSWFLPQNRERIYLVGCLGEGSGQEIFPIEKNDQKTKQLQRQQAHDNTITKNYAGIGNGSYVIEREQQKAEVGDFRYDEGYRIRKDGICPTLHTKTKEKLFINKTRRLTPIECERLQGFPDDWTKQGTKGIISDSQRYKLLGNAVTVDVVEAVAQKIIKL